MKASTVICALAFSATTALAHVTEPSPTGTPGCVEGEHAWICPTAIATGTPAGTTAAPVTTSVPAEENHHGSESEHGHSTQSAHEHSTESENGQAHSTGHAHSTAGVTASPTPTATLPFTGGAAGRGVEMGLLGGFIALAGMNLRT